MGKRHRPKKLCTKVKYLSRDAALAHLRQLRDKGIRGSARLRTYACDICSKRNQEVYHVGHNNGKKVAV